MENSKKIKFRIFSMLSDFVICITRVVGSVSKLWKTVGRRNLEHTSFDTNTLFTKYIVTVKSMCGVYFKSIFL